MVRTHRSGVDPEAPLPDVDERLIQPGCRYEAIEGELVYVSPADETHGSLHSKLSHLLEAYAADGFDAAADMLTRTSEFGDMAPDGSVFPAARDPETGGRQIEQLAFEILSTESLSHAGHKAAALRARGVRRVFGIDVEHRAVLEWSVETGAWSILGPDAVIADPALALPLPVAPLVGAATAANAVAAALIAKRTPAIVAAVAAGEAKGLAQGEIKARVENVLDLLAARGLAPTAAQVAQLRATTDAVTLRTWFIRAATAPTADEVFAPVAR